MMSHSVTPPEVTSPSFPFSRLWAGALLLAILSVCAPRCHATPPPTTTTTVSVSPSASVSEGTVLTLQATVNAGASAVATGSVTFYDGATALANVPLVNTESSYTYGTANLKVRLGPGSHIITALYTGTTGYLSSTSSPQTITVTGASSATTATKISSSGSAGSYTLSGKVTAFSSTAPTGSVFFVDQTNNNFSLGSAALDAASQTGGWQVITPFATSGSTYGVVIGDLNGDGLPDLVSSNYGGSALSVLLGDGDGTFRTHVDYAVGSYPFGLALGDLNGDGYPDVVVAYHTNGGIGVLLGNGDGTFQAVQTIATSGVSEYVALADLNRDGILDIITLGSNGEGGVSVLLGNGNGTFQAAQSYGAGAYPYGLAVADFDKNGKVDVAVSDYDGNTVSVLLGNGDGTLQEPAAYIVGTSPTNLVAVDLDGDGNQDLVVSNNESSTVSVLLGNGDGTFKAKVDYPVSSPWGVAAADVNGDGIPDVLVTSLDSSVFLLQGKGDGTLLAGVSTATGAANYIPALGDLNGDGVIDLVVANLGSSNVLESLGSISATATVTGVSIPGGGAHNVVGNYEGDAHSAESTSSLISLTGSQISTSLSLNVSPDPVAPGQSATLSALVSSSNSGGYSPSGTVSFFDGGAAIDSAVSLNNGHATLSKSDFASGDHDITAAYSGDTNFVESTASVATLTVSVPDYSISASPSALTIRRGQTGTATLTVTPVGAYTGPVAFTCSGLPQFATCSFSPASVQMDGSDTVHTVQFRLTTTGPLASPASSDFGRRQILALLFPFLFLSLLPITKRRRNSAAGARSPWRPLKWLHMLVLATLFLGVAGCGSSSSPAASPKTPLGTSTVTATAAAVGGSATHTASITITITD